MNSVESKPHCKILLTETYTEIFQQLKAAKQRKVQLSQQILATSYSEGEVVRYIEGEVITSSED